MIERLALLWRRFAPVETHLLLAVRGVLPPEARPIFDAQVAAVNRVQRSPPAWNEICLYRLVRRKVDWTGVPLFRCTDEFRLAEVRFQCAGRQYQTTLTSIGGHILDFATTPGPKAVAFAKWEAEPTAALLGDPLRESTGERPREHLPAVWQEVLAEDAGQCARGWVLHDATSAYRLSLDSGVYLVLAEREGQEFILERIGERRGGFFYLEQHDGVPALLEGAVEDLLGGRRTRG